MIGSGLGHMTHALARVRHLRKTPGLGEGSGGKWGQLFPGEGGLAFVGMAGGSLGRGRSGSGTGEARPGGAKGGRTRSFEQLGTWASTPESASRVHGLLAPALGFVPGQGLPAVVAAAGRLRGPCLSRFSHLTMPPFRWLVIHPIRSEATRFF